MPKQKNTDQAPEFSPEQMAQLMRQLEEQKREIALLKTEKEAGVILTRHRFGALQIKGLRNGYLGFYRDEWETLLSLVPRIRQELDENDEILTKEQSYEQYPKETRQSG